MKSSAGVRLRLSLTGRRQSTATCPPSRRTFSPCIAKAVSVHPSLSSTWDARYLLEDAVVWAETTSVCESVDLFEEIGAGAYGSVHRGVDCVTGEAVAIKRIPTRGNGVPGSSVSSFKIQLETEIHKSLNDCPSVASLKGHVHLNDDAEGVVTELCEGGDLAEYVDRNGPMNEEQIRCVAEEAAGMLRTCHARQILHGDIKATNFVVRSEDDALMLTHNPRLLRTGWLKAIDFGCSKRMGKGKCSHKAGTPTHWPPEVFAQRFGLEADMWSFGTMLYFLATKRMPYFTNREELEFRSERDVLLAIIRNRVDFESMPWKTFGDDAKDFVRRLLELEEKQRMTAEEAMRHPFLARSRNRSMRVSLTRI